MPRKKRPPVPPPVIRPLAPKHEPADDGAAERAKISLPTRPGTSKFASASLPLRHSSSSASAPSAEHGQTDASRRPALSTCGVPQCKRLNCKLPTHLNYAKQLSLIDTAENSLAVSRRSSLASSEISFNYEPGLAGHAKLPIANVDSRLIGIFHTFFNENFEQMALTFRPPNQMANIKARSFQLALENEVYCLTCIAQGYLERLRNRNTNISAADELTALIYSKLLKTCREFIETFPAEKPNNVDFILLAIVQLCQVDLSLNRIQAVRSHYAGLKALVAKQGGMHNLSLMCLPYVSRMDRRIALFENRVPELELSATPKLATSTPSLPRRGPKRTGTAFTSSTEPGFHLLSPAIRTFCTDAAFLTEIMFDSNINYDPQQLRAPQKPELNYFYYLRESVDARHAILAPRLARGEIEDATTTDALAVGAAKIVTYITTQTNYLPKISVIVAERLWDVLLPTLDRGCPGGKGKGKSKQNANELAATTGIVAWYENFEMLQWLLYSCALAYMSYPYPLDPSQAKRWESIIALIAELKEIMFGQESLYDSSAYDEQVLDMLNHFVWSETLGTQYAEITTETQRFAAERNQVREER